MFRNLKRMNRRVTRISTSKTRIMTETNCVQSRARVKVASRELVSSVECEDTRRTDAGRKEKVKEEKEIGRKEKEDTKEPKKRSNSGHTWDNSWYHSNWHGMTYGLEVDPWAAVDPILYLCAVSLKSSCEEFTEPKHVRKAHCTDTLPLENSGTFSHENRFSILASSDDEKYLSDREVEKQVIRIKSQNWKSDGERDDEFSYREEQVDARILRSK